MQCEKRYMEMCKEGSEVNMAVQSEKGEAGEWRAMKCKWKQGGKVQGSGGELKMVWCMVRGVWSTGCMAQGRDGKSNGDEQSKMRSSGCGKGAMWGGGSEGGAELVGE